MTTTTAAARDELVVLTPYAELDAPEFNDEVARFEAETGTPVRVRSVAGDLVDELLLELSSDHPPDMAVIPQPGVMEDLVEAGAIEPIPESLAAVNDDLLPVLRDLSTVDGVEYSVWTVASVSAVWYRSDIFAANGWKVPTTFEQFEQLLATIAATDYAPLCLGTKSGGATGWSITDYVELIMLATAGSDSYDAWVGLYLPFSSPQVLDALTTTQRWITDPQVSLGAAAIADRQVDEGFEMLARTKPRCVMNIASDWVLGGVEEQVAQGDVELFVPVSQADPDVVSIGSFDFPSQDPAHPALLLGGDQLVSFTDDDRAWELMEYVASPAWGVAWAGTGKFVSPYLDFDPTAYATRRQIEAAASLGRSQLARFDGADLMPTEVGTSEMWGAMIDLLDGVGPETVAANLDEVAGSMGN